MHLAYILSSLSEYSLTSHKWFKFERFSRKTNNLVNQGEHFMNMNKSLIALAVAGVFATSAAIADVSIYGQANVSYDMVDNDGGRDSTGVGSNASRLGFKGSEALGGGLSAIWQVESQIAIGNGAGPFDNPGSQTGVGFRDTFAGLKGDTWGSVRLGRIDTPYKLATRRMDMFHNTIADNRSLMGIGHDIRTNNTISYTSANYSGFNLGASYFGDQQGTAPQSQTGFYNSINNTNEGFSVAGTFDSGPFLATAAYQSNSNGPAPANPSMNSDAWKFALGYSVDQFSINGIVERISARNSTAGNSDSTAWHLSGRYNMSPSDAIKASYTDVDNSISGTQNTGAKQFAIGYDHKMSVRTTMYALYSKLDNDQGAGYQMGWNSSGTSASNAAFGNSPSAFSVGMKHSF